mgnify:CR=1 FL=1
MAWDGSLKRKSDRRSEDETPDIKTSLSLIGQSLKSIEETQERHDHILFGKDENKGGLILEVDRLKEHKKNTERTAFVVYSTAIGLILKTIWDLIIKR